MLSIYHKPTATTPVPQLTQLTEQLMEIRRGALGDTRQAVADALGGVLGREVRPDTLIVDELSLYDHDQLRAAGKGGLIDARREVDFLNSALNTLGSTTYLSFMQLDEQESQMTEGELFVHVATEAAQKKINKIDRLLQYIEKPTVTDDMVANAGLGEVHDQIRNVLFNWHDLDKDALVQEMIPGFVERMKSGDWGIAIKGDWARADTATVIGRYHMEEAVWRSSEEAGRMRRSAEIAKANGGSGIFYQMRLDRWLDCQCLCRAVFPNLRHSLSRVFSPAEHRREGVLGFPRNGGFQNIRLHATARGKGSRGILPGQFNGETSWLCNALSRSSNPTQPAAT